MNTDQASIRYPKPWEATLIVALVLILVQVGAGIGGVFGLSAVQIAVQLVILLPSLIWIAIRRYPVRQNLRLNGIDGQSAIWSASIGLVCWPIVAGIAALIDQGLSRIGPGPQAPYPASTFESVVYALVLIFVAPITEEPVFRGFVMGAWLRRVMLPGLLLSGFLFASVHSSIAAILPLTLLGTVFGFLAHRSNSLLSSITAHMAYNALGSLFILVPSLQGPSVGLLARAGAVAALLAIPLPGMWRMRMMANRTSRLVPPRRTPGHRKAIPSRFGWRQARISSSRTFNMEVLPCTQERMWKRGR